MSPAALAAASDISRARRNQTLAIVWAELRRNFITRRGFWIYGLALLTPTLVTWHSIVAIVFKFAHDFSRDTTTLAFLFQIFFLRPAVFFGAVGIFTWLFRGEVIQKTLHHYFLTPVRREVLVIAKYIAGAITAIAFFGGSFVLTFIGMYLHWPGFEIRDWLFSGPGLGHFCVYLGITVLACLSWGSVFLWMGIRFRNPVVPSVVFLGWESLNVFLPSWLRRLSVLHHLQSLSPVEAGEGAPGVVLRTTAEPERAVTAILLLLLITAIMLVLSLREIRKTEISYSSD